MWRALGREMGLPFPWMIRHGCLLDWVLEQLLCMCKDIFVYGVVVGFIISWSLSVLVAKDDRLSVAK
jgi:hypothetical protein